MKENKFVAINSETQSILERDYNAGNRAFDSEPATERIKDAIRRAANIRGLRVVVDLDSLTNGEARELLEDVNEMPFPPSKKQIELIEKNCKRLGEPMPPLETLSGGRNGTASKLIEEQLERIALLPRLATERMWNLVEDYSNCMEEGVDIKADELIARKEAGAEPEYDEVSDFIGWAAPIVGEWRDRVASKEQVKAMIRINVRMGNPYDEKMFKNVPREHAEEVIEKFNKEYRMIMMDKMFQKVEAYDNFRRKEVDVKTPEDNVRKELEKLLVNLNSVAGDDDNIERAEGYDMEYI